MAPLLTLFTAPKSFENPHINTIQRNTLRNWLALGDEVAVVVIGDDPGLLRSVRNMAFNICLMCAPTSRARR